MRILITGVSGLIGRYVLNHPLRPKQALLFGTSKRTHDHEDFQRLSGYAAANYSDRERYASLIREFKPDVIAHLGSEGNVDSVQKNPEESRISNLEFPLFLLDQAGKTGARIVQFSSNAVYDGNRAPYSENSPLNPVNLYGELKKQVDLATRSFSGDWLILRPIIAYGWNYAFGRTNPVSRFLPMLQGGQPIKLVTDQWENPVYAGDVATVFWRCLLEGISGEFNLAGGDPAINRYDWIRCAAEVFGLDTALIQKASMNDFASLTPRPRDTSFSAQKIRKALGFQPMTVKEGAMAMREDSVLQLALPVASGKAA